MLTPRLPCFTVQTSINLLCKCCESYKVINSWVDNAHSPGSMTLGDVFDFLNSELFPYQVVSSRRYVRKFINLSIIVLKLSCVHRIKHNHIALTSPPNPSSGEWRRINQQISSKYGRTGDLKW